MAPEVGSLGTVSDPHSATKPRSVTSLESRRSAIAAALHAVGIEPVPARRPRTDAAAPGRLEVVKPPAVPDPELAALVTEVRRLTERLDRVEDTVEMIRADRDEPLDWPVAVGDDERRLEVPPLDLSRGTSPAFDVLLGPSAGS